MVEDGRVSIDARMSASGQKRTFRCARVMSALPPKADIRPRDQDVCFGPGAYVSRLYWEDLISPLRQTGRAPRGHQKSFQGGNQFQPSRLLVWDGWGFYLLSPLQSWMRDLSAPTLCPFMG